MRENLIELTFKMVLTVCILSLNSSRTFKDFHKQLPKTYLCLFGHRVSSARSIIARRDNKCGHVTMK